MEYEDRGCECQHGFLTDAGGKGRKAGSAGSGFLALDSNDDGIINDGRELFGPRTGSGFTELAAYDEDKNNWIDENDWVYTHLLLWTKDSEGNDYLHGLQEKGIGAIYLDHVDSKFNLGDHHNNPMGQLNRSSIYMKENAEVGTIQELDLVV